MTTQLSNFWFKGRYLTMVFFIGMVVSVSFEKTYSQSITISYPASQTYTIGSPITSLLPTVTGGPASSSGQTTFTLAGSTSFGWTDGVGTAASFYIPLSTAVDGSGNVYVADSESQRIRKITPTGIVTTMAGNSFPGSTNGTGAAASFRHPAGVAVDATGNVFVGDQQNHLIRKVTQAGVVTTFAGTGSAGSSDGTGTSASFSSPIGLAFDASGNLYVADYGNNKIRKITPAGVVSTFAGTGSQGASNGSALSATFKNPMDVAIDAAGNMYVADRMNYLVRKISGGIVSTLAGSGAAGSANGTGTSASFNRPNSVDVDVSGNVYVADDANHVIRKISSGGVVTTLAGAVLTSGSTNGTGSVVRFNSPYGLSVDKQGNVFVAELANHMIRKVVTSSYTIVPNLPAGLVFNNTTGAISGTPTELSLPTDYQIQAFNATHSSNVVTINIEVNNLPATSILASQNQNYIIEYKPRVANLTTTADLIASTADRAKLQATVQYYDGLGRPLQTVEWQGSPNKRDLVTPVSYDAFGRDDKKYLAYTATISTSNGSYKANGVADQNSFYTSPSGTTWNAPNVAVISGNTAVSKTVFEMSPLNRVLEQGAPGAPWQPATTRSTTGRTVANEYATNTVADSVKMWVASANGASVTVNYPAKKLSKIITKDENWTTGKPGTTEEFKDFEGRVLLKRVWETATLSRSTYYVYDDLSNLRFVIPPSVTVASFTEVSTDLQFNQYIFGYKYDLRKRLIEKKVPEKGWEYIVYNWLDQVVLTQDAVQRSKANQDWTVTKYDGLGRIILTGIHNYGATANQNYRAAIQALVDAQSYQWENRIATGYTDNRTYPTTALTTVLSMQYYDDYTAPSMPYNFSTSPLYSKMTKGLPTASLTNVLGTSVLLWTVNYYDDEGRVVKIYKQHYQTGALNNNNYDEISNSYNFTGELTASTRIHKNGTASTTIVNRNKYDHMGRQLTTKMQINAGTEVMLNKLEYNEIGQLVTKKLHSTDSVNYLQNTKYTYNQRGWLKRMIAADFSLRLGYDTLTTPQYNGNIVSQEWGKNYTFSNKFSYVYDKLNRLTNGTSTGSILMSEVLTYDAVGNIRSMNRDAAGVGTYNYTGNRLKNITGGPLATGTYSYDPNGNATTDGRTGINLTYNLFNLPATAIRTATAPAVNLIYTYDASGTKLRKVSTGVVAGTRHYIDGIEYDNNTIDIIQTSEGIARNNGGIYTYEYNLKDHLGNTRYAFKSTSGVLTRLQEINYFPFGAQKVVSAGPNKYLYNGKEIQEELSVSGVDGQYDYGARFYDPIIGRWNVPDPMSESYHGYSPYNYGLDDPIGKLDPNGMWVETAGSYYTNDPQEIESALKHLRKKDDDDDDEKKPKKKGRNVVNKAGSIVRKTQDGYSVSQQIKGDGTAISDITETLLGFSPFGIVIDITNAIEARDRSGTELSMTWRLLGLAPLASEFRGGRKLFLNASKVVHKHHILPQQFRKWFAQQGIKNIDDYTVRISQYTHSKGVHGKGVGNLEGGWNKQWSEFIKANPNASPSAIFNQAETMLKQYGLNHIPYEKFK